MAKPKDTPLFEEPEFDEKDFLITEKDRAKGVLLIFVIGALSGVFASYLQLAGYTYLAILLMLAILVLLTRILTIFGIRAPPKTSHKIINYGVYILTWVLFWTIFLNPPLHVVSSPQIQNFSVQPQGQTTWTTLQLNANDQYQSPTGPNQYSIHLTYKYSFNVTNFYYIQQGQTTHNTLNVPLSNGYLNFSLTGSVSNIDDFYIAWNSQASSNPQPLTFTLVFS